MQGKINLPLEHVEPKVKIAAFAERMTWLAMPSLLVWPATLCCCCRCRCWQPPANCLINASTHVMQRLENSERDVVTFGVLTNKGTTKQAKNSKNYATWTLTNLDTASVSSCSSRLVSRGCPASQFLARASCV